MSLLRMRWSKINRKKFLKPKLLHPGKENNLGIQNQKEKGKNYLGNRNENIKCQRSMNLKINSRGRLSNQVLQWKKRAKNWKQ